MKSYQTLCDPMNCHTPGFPVLHNLSLLKLMSIDLDAHISPLNTRLLVFITSCIWWWISAIWGLFQAFTMPFRERLVLWGWDWANQQPGVERAYVGMSRREGGAAAFLSDQHLYSHSSVRQAFGALIHSARNSNLKFPVHEKSWQSTGLHSLCKCYFESGVKTTSK